MTTPQPGDSRRFGYWVGHFVVVGSMIGSGILTTSGFTLQATGNPAALLGLWVLGGLLALCGAVTIAELATTLPKTGGDYIFVREAFGQGAGFVSGWATFVLGFAAPTAVVANLSITYLTAPFTSELANALGPAAAFVVPAGATAVILIIGFIHTLGHRHSSQLQIAATVLTAAILIAIAGGGILTGRGDWSHLVVGGWPTRNQWPALAAGLIFVGFAYGGWNAAGYLAGEIRNPARTLPLCLIGGVTTVIVLYLLVNVAYVYALDPLAMMSMTEEEVKPVAKLAAAVLFGPEAAASISVALGLGLLATLSAVILTGPRIAYAMAVDRVFPSYAARLHSTRQTPVAATAIQAILACAMVWLGSLEQLLNYAGVGFAAISGLTVASVIPLRWRAELPHPYRLPLFPLPPLAYLLLIGWTIAFMLISANGWDARLPGLLSLATIVAGIPLSRLLVRPGA